MPGLLNAQYNLAPPDGRVSQTAAKMRHRLFAMFMQNFQPAETDEMLDLGATSDRTYSSSNYFEMLYPHKDRIVAAGTDDASFLEQQYPGVKFQFANAVALPFGDKSFDYVHSSAVLEHVGSIENQARMVAECARVARKGIWLTTPNRWFPVEFHTLIPFAHWLPKRVFRSILSAFGQPELALEENLNLMDTNTLQSISRAHRRHNSDWSLQVSHTRLFGWPSNLVLSGRRESPVP